MAERATVYEDSIYRVEDSPGSGTGNLYRLLGTNTTIDTESMVRVFRRASSKFSTSASVGKEHTSGKLDGDQTINDLLFLSRSLLCKGSVSTPSNNGVWTVGIGAASAGTFTLTIGGQTATGLAYTITASALQTALAALTSLGPGLVKVTGAAPTWTVTLYGPMSTGGALTIDGTGLTAGTPTSTSATATATRRWTLTPSWNSADDAQTFEVQKGVSGSADDSSQTPFVGVAGLSFKWNPTEASFTGDLVGDITVDPFTMATTSITDLAVVPVDPDCISVWLGSALSGANAPTKLLRLLDLELDITGKWDVLKTLNCEDPGISALVEKAPTATAKFTIEHDAQGRSALAWLRAGTVVYMVFEATAGLIEAGFKYRLKWTAPLKITKITKGDTDGVFSSTFETTIEYTTAMGSAIKFEFDTAMAAF